MAGLLDAAGAAPRPAKGLWRTEGGVRGSEAVVQGKRVGLVGAEAAVPVTGALAWSAGAVVTGIGRQVRDAEAVVRAGGHHG